MPTSLEAGRTVKHYELLEEIDRGGAGVVFRARDTKLDRVVALKFVPVHDSGGGRGADAILAEARSAAALDHPGICNIFEIDRFEDHAFIAMAFVDGPSLAEILANRSISIDEAVDYAIQIGEALHAAHLQRIVHRDVKSSNVVVGANGRIKLVDFGLAQLPQAFTPGDMADTQSAGTLAYMPPERLMGQRFDHRSDIWGLGVVLYELLSGELPFRGASAAAMVASILTGQPRPVSTLRAGVPWRLERIIDRSMARDVRSRYARMEEMVADLRELRAEEPRMDAVSGPVSAGGAPTKILVVDDETDLELLVRQKFRRGIRAGRVDFTFALSATDGLAALDADPDLRVVMTDIQMPGMNGLAFLRELQRTRRDVKPVVVSAFGDLGNIRAAMNGGAFDFITKPIDFDDLEATLEKAARALEADQKAAEARRRLAAIEQELDAARRIHESMAPVIPSREGVDLYCFERHSEVPHGQFFDVLAPSDGSTLMVSGEVQGSGITATTLATVARALIRTGFAGEGSFPERARFVGRVLRKEFAHAPWVACTFVSVAADRTSLSFAVAGDRLPLLLLPEGTVEVLGTETAVLGSRAGDLAVETVPLRPGSTVLSWTAGLVDQCSPQLEPFSRSRLEEALASSAGGTSRTCVSSVIDAVERFAENVSENTGGLALAATVTG